MTAINVKVLAIIAGLIVVGGGAYVVVHNRAETVDDVGMNEEHGNAMSLRALASARNNVKCTFSTTNNGIVSEGVTYVANGQIRSDFTTKNTAAGDIDSHMIVKDNTNYVWSSANAQGIKMAVNTDASAHVNANTQTGVDYDANVDYDCDAWSPDSSFFEVPTSITFMDMSSMMSGGAQTQGSASGSVQGSVTAPNAAVRGSVDASAEIKVQQCAACDSLSDAQKTQCKLALQCK